MAELRDHQRWCRRVAKSLGLDPDSPRALVVREVLLSRLFTSAMNKNRKPGALIKELQQAMKAVPTEVPKTGKKTSAEKKDLKHHLDQLYGPGVVLVEDDNDE